MIDFEMISYKVILWFCVRVELRSRFSAHTLSCLAVDQSGWMAWFHSFYQALMCTYSVTENSPGGHQANVWELSGKKIVLSGPSSMGLVCQAALAVRPRNTHETAAGKPHLLFLHQASLDTARWFFKGFRSRYMFISSNHAGVLQENVI